MGANPYSDAAGSGVTFRVWAPFASAVAVAGSFNGWSQTASSLASEGNGFWSTDITAAKASDQYKFVVTNATAGTLWRMDPYVTRIIHDGGNLNGVIDSPSTGFVGGRYSTPGWNELIIYEMHIRTFLSGDGSMKDASGASIRTSDGSFIGSFDSGRNEAELSSRPGNQRH
jgi:1,4-alpha-glucan branching enzyme